MVFTRMSNHSYNDFTTWSTGSNATISLAATGPGPDITVSKNINGKASKNVFLGARILVERRRPTHSGAMAVACDGPSRAAGVSAGEFRFTPLGSGPRTSDELPTAAPRSGGGMLTQSTNGFIRST
ncbi:hypothetical protein OUZ56_009593 [Daphnia magna]|uniref:Uncharacterized protein n=1 Tax=Daphnia magna TaxID=35525 RepID=A0ABR0AGI1_9CRUS|nr:hypothetical protein OUZ56_009593 [Daphnia magna]